MVVGSREQAQRLLERVRSGEDFATLARAESIDPSAADGGLLGRIAHLDAAAGSAKPHFAASAPARSHRSCRCRPGLRSSAWNTTAISRRRRRPLQPGAPRHRQREVRASTSAACPKRKPFFANTPKPATWNQDPRDDLSDARRFAHRRTAPFDDFFSPRMEAIRNTRTPFELMQAHLGLAQLLAYDGDLAHALPHFQAGLAGRDRAACLTRGTMVEEMLGAGALSQGRNGQRRVSHARRVVPDSDAAWRVRSPKPMTPRGRSSTCSAICSGSPTIWKCAGC